MGGLRAPSSVRAVAPASEPPITSWRRTHPRAPRRRRAAHPRVGTQHRLTLRSDQGLEDEDGACRVGQRLEQGSLRGARGEDCRDALHAGVGADHPAESPTRRRRRRHQAAAPVAKFSKKFAATLLQEVLAHFISFISSYKSSREMLSRNDQLVPEGVGRRAQSRGTCYVDEVRSSLFPSSLSSSFDAREERLLFLLGQPRTSSTHSPAPSRSRRTAFSSRAAR